MGKAKITFFHRDNRLQELIDNYFESCNEAEGVYSTVQGLARAIGISPSALIRMKNDPDCDDRILHALLVCEEQAEALLLSDKSADFAIEQLKLHGWKDDL